MKIEFPKYYNDDQLKAFSYVDSGYTTKFESVSPATGFAQIVNLIFPADSSSASSMIIPNIYDPNSSGLASGNFHFKLDKVRYPASEKSVSGIIVRLIDDSE